MEITAFVIATSFISINMVVCVDFQPRHVHLSLGMQPNSLVVTWSTVNETNEPSVILGRKKIERVYKGSSKLFIDGGNESSEQWIHTVSVHGLKPDTNYFYRVGSDLGWSNYFYTKTIKDEDNWSPTFALFGDMGNENAASLPFLQKGSVNGMFDIILHVGDMAYDLAEENGHRGDVFMEQIEPIASTVPYMTCPGNHEHHYNFSNYKARFTMPQDEGRMFYSFNVGPVHFVAVSTEFYYYTEFGMDPLINQYYWLKEDLEEANTPSARAKQPWVVVFGHRPMYCSNNDRDDCTKYETKTRVGLSPNDGFGLEDLLYENDVDLAVWAHEHSYERLLPVYNMTIMSGPDAASPYTDPKAPVHIVTGSAGCREKHDGFIDNPPPWSVVRNSEYGFTLMKVLNSTHLRVEQLSVEPDLHPVDKFWIVKNTHKYSHPTSDNHV